MRMLEHRGRPEPGSGRHTVLDLDWRPMFWASPDDAREARAAMLAAVDVVVGNRAEVEVAVGTADPEEAAARLLAAAWRWRSSSSAPTGCSSRPATGRPPWRRCPVEVVCGLGAGDAFGGALVTACSPAGTRRARRVRQRGRSDRRLPARVRRRHADPRRARRDAGVGGPSRPRAKEPVSSAHRRAVALPAGDPGPSPGNDRRGATRRPAPGARCARRATMFIVAADHTARGCSGSAATRWRWPTGARCSTGCWSPWPTRGSTACSASADIIEDLVLLGALDERVAVGHDEPRRPRRRHLEDGRPVHRLRRRSPRALPASTPARCCCASTTTTPAPCRRSRGAPRRSASSTTGA